MKYLVNHAGSYLTGDDIADAVMEYGRALVENERAELVDVPFVGSSGEHRCVQLVVGWGAALNAVSPIDIGRVELIDTAITAQLRRDAKSLLRDSAPSGDTPLSQEELAWLHGETALW